MRRERIDFWQNITIAMLTVSAVFLFSRTSFFRVGWEDSAAFSFPEEVIFPERSAASLTLPLRLAVTDRDGRYGSVTLTTDSAAFPRRALERAFARGVPEIEESRRADFLRVLDGVSVYCDFLRPLPLSVLLGLVSAPATEKGDALEWPSVRCAALAGETDAVWLYLWDGADGYFRLATVLALGELEEAAARRGALSPAFFAMDRTGALYQNVFPLSLFLEETPRLPVLSAVRGIPDADRLLTALHFNPRTHSHYTEPNGTEVIVEDGRSVRIRADGSIYYQSGGRGDLSVDCAGETPTDWEAVSGCAAILEAILSGEGGPAFQEILRDGERTILRFGCQRGGVPIRFSDGAVMAAVMLDRAEVVSLELLPWQFTALEEKSMLLPLTQALGIAGQTPGAELSLGYTGDASRLYAQWMAGLV